MARTSRASESAPPDTAQTSGPGAVRLVLEGAKSNRSAIGAEIEAKVGARTLRRRVKSGSSYLSASDLPVTLGLGSARQVDSVTIRWPSGALEAVPALTVGSEYHIREGAGVVDTRPLAAP